MFNTQCSKPQGESSSPSPLPLSPAGEKGRGKGGRDPQGSKTRPEAWALLLFLVIIQVTPTPAQDKKKRPKTAAPRIAVILPLGAAAGKTTRLTIRGSGLDKATEVKLAHGKAKMISKGTAAVPDKNPDRVGDTQVVAEVTLDTKIEGGSVALSVVTPQGETKPHPLLVEWTIPVVPEKEPNEGFRQSQEIKLPVVVEGTIERPKDVDVFRFTAKKGQKIAAEALAHRYGSPLDAMLTLYNAAGQQLAFSDDLSAQTRDARLEAVLPADGVYYLTLIDAHDAGSAVHAYRLVVQEVRQ